MINEMNIEQIEARKAEIETLLNDDGADLEALSKEVDALNERKAQIVQEAENRKAEIDKVLKEAPTETLEELGERTKMTDLEVRNSKAYIDAFANYIKTGKDEEVRALLTENVNNGTVPVPEFVEEVVKHAWDNDSLLSRVRKTAFKGNLKVGYEVSSDGAVIHAEGDTAIDEEALVTGIINLVPETIKKFVRVSDEVLDNGEAFLRYIYDEITHHIIKKACDMIVADIIASVGTMSTAVATSGAQDFLNALAQLSDEASNPVIIMNKQSYAYYKGLAYQNSYAIDIFEGMTVLFNNTLAVADGSTAGNYAIVGDLGAGFWCNFPNGFEPTFKYDDLTEATADMVRVIGRLPMAHAVVAPKHFAVIKKA